MADNSAVKAEILGMLNKLSLSVPKIQPKTDPDTFGQDVTAESTDAHLNTFMIEKIAEYRFDDISADYKTLQDFRDDFGGWQEETFKRVDKDLLKKMRDILRFKGIAIPLGRPYTKVLMDLFKLREYEMPEWSQADLENTVIFRESKMRRQTGGTPRTPSITPVEPLRVPSPTPRGPVMSAGLPQPTQGTPVAPPMMTPVIGQQGGGIADPYDSVPPLPVARSVVPIEQQKATSFSKLWKSSYEFTGKPYDILDDKIRHFHSTCKLAQIHPEHFHEVFFLMLADNALNYYLYNSFKHLSFYEMYWKTKNYFDTEVNHGQYHKDWTSTTFVNVKNSKDFADKEPMEALNALFDKLQRCQRALGPSYAGEAQLIDATMRACRGVKDLEYALQKPARHFEVLISDLRASLETARQRSLSSSVQYYGDHTVSSTNMLDRKYRGEHSRSGKKGQAVSAASSWRKRCYVCGKTGCFSTKHTTEEREKSRKKWKESQEYLGAKRGMKEYSAFLANFEGEDDSDEDDKDDEAVDDSNFVTAITLSNQAYLHRLCAPGEDKLEGLAPASQFVLDRYSQTRFQGILPDSGAARNSTAGKSQFLALQRERPELRLDDTRAGEVTMRFGAERVLTSVGVADVETPFGAVDFHILDIPTPFLLSLADMDRLGVEFHNLTNEMVSADKSVPVTRKWGHAWFALEDSAFLTESELRRLHTRFGHCSVRRLHELLTKVGHEVDLEALRLIEKFCHYCQMRRAKPQRFKFTLRDDKFFNYEVFVDILYIDSCPVLHIVDGDTSFQAAGFMNNGFTAKETWELFRKLWIDTYLGPPDVVTHDAGTNFASTEFRGEARLLGVTCHQVPVEAHHSIGSVERYHGPLRRAYDVLKEEVGSSISRDARLQMAVKNLNDTAGPEGLVPTLLVFGAYPRITAESMPSLSVVERGRAVAKATAEVRKLIAKRRINDALNTRNGPRPMLPSSLSVGDEVRIYREKLGWRGPYEVVSTGEHDVTVEMDNGISTFRITSVQPYYRTTAEPQDEGNEDGDTGGSGGGEDEPQEGTTSTREEARRTGRIRRPTVPFDEQYLTHREKSDAELAVRLRRLGKITTPGAPFELSDDAEINGLFDTGVLEPVVFEKRRHAHLRLFKSRLVREVKGKQTDKPYEKSRLVVQGYGDNGKLEILTQAPTVQRASQRLLLAIAPTLIEQRGMTIMLRDITQAYTQSRDPLKREIYVSLPAELKNKFPPGTILRVVKPLYGIAEAGVYWYATYVKHHRDQLMMEPSALDPCLLITKTDIEFGASLLQTDDTLSIGTEAFLEREERKICDAGFKAKKRTILTDENEVDFNGSRIRIKDGIITVAPRGQEKKLAMARTVNEYVEQRARGAYIATVCQPEAAFDLSVAAQAQKPEMKDFDRLNQRIQWQIDAGSRGLRYVPLDLATARLYIFADGSFANNSDLTSQIGFVIILANETENDDESFTLRGNIVHWSSTKCKRVTRSVLASEIYALVSGFDHGYMLANTLQTITERLGLPSIPIIVCTDSYSLYECLVKLGTTTEKRLMIDISALRQSYERREITEIRWINGGDNPADAMTKVRCNDTLRRVIDENELTVRLEGWVERA